MYKSIKVEAENNELILENSYGDKAIIPADKREFVKKKLEEGCNECIDELVETLPVASEYAEDGAIVSKLYEQKTGRKWSTAKELGLTDGSYEQNMKLRNDLLNNKLVLPNDTSVSKNSSPVSNSSSSVQTNLIQAKTFDEAFKQARQQLGANRIFEWNGRKYGTNLKGETFTPSEEELKAHNLNNQTVRDRLKKEEELVQNEFTSRKTIKLQEDEYRDWNKVRRDNAELNKKSQADLIKKYMSDTAKGSKYAIVDKKKGLLHIYEAGKDSPLYSSPIDLGGSVGDTQTVTKLQSYDKYGNKSESYYTYKRSSVRLRYPPHFIDETGE